MIQASSLKFLAATKECNMKLTIRQKLLSALAILLIDRRTQQSVWSSAIQLASDVPVAEEARGQLSQQLAAQLLGSLPSD